MTENFPMNYSYMLPFQKYTEYSCSHHEIISNEKLIFFYFFLTTKHIVMEYSWTLPDIII